MSAPRVAVVGGGLTGSLAALVLRSRGLNPTVYDAGRRAAGGRALGGRHPDSGLQFLRASDPASQVASVLEMLARDGLVAPWEGRFGLLGAKGGFLPREVIADTPLKDMMKKEEVEPSSSVDFCGFLAQAEQPMYVGTPANASICAGIHEAAGFPVALGSHVLAAHPAAGGWSLRVSEGGSAAATVEYDALVLASHDASLAATAVRAIIDSGLDALEGAVDVGDSVGARLAALASALQAQREARTAPLFTWSGYYPAGFSEGVPFDAAAVPGSSLVDFVARDASKPGRPAAYDGELWTAVSSAGFARTLLGRAAAAEAGDSDKGGAAAAEAAAAISSEMARLFAPFFGGDAAAVAPPTLAAAKRWGAALPSGTLGLEEDSVGLEPWRLAIAGDFVRSHPSPAEAAAHSGLDAGERVASWFADGG